MLCYVMILGGEWFEDDPCGQMLKKDEVYVHESFLLTRVILYYDVDYWSTISTICPLMF